MNDAVAVITGAAGYIGSALSQWIAAQYPICRVVGIDRRTRKGSSAADIDLADYHATREALESIQPDVIFHLAGIARGSDWEKLYVGNIQTTTNILKAVQAIGKPTRVLIPGSAAEYGPVLAADLPISEIQLPNPINAYGCIKAIQTTIARYYASLGIDVVVGRIFNVIGPALPETVAIGAFAAQLARIRAGSLPPRVETGNLGSRRDFVDIRDICNALVLLAERGRRGEIYNICSASSVSMKQLLSLLIQCSGLDVQVIEKNNRGNIAEIDVSVGSNKKICTEIGWRAEKSIEGSISDVWQSIAASAAS